MELRVNSSNSPSSDKTEGAFAITAYKTAAKVAFAEHIEKKSRFLSHIAPVSNEEEAKAFIDGIKKQHNDATHNVYAYILQGTGIARFSDDGEPQGTAGMPILEVLKREELTGVVCVVTRYFGGILLGAGGLVRAYAKGAKLALDEAGAALFVPFVTFTLRVSYGEFEKIERDLAKYNVRHTTTDYTDSVTLHLSAEQESIDAFFIYVRDISAGKAICTITGERFEAKPI